MPAKVDDFPSLIVLTNPKCCLVLSNYSIYPGFLYHYSVLPSMITSSLHAEVGGCMCVAKYPPMPLTVV